MKKYLLAFIVTLGVFNVASAQRSYLGPSDQTVQHFSPRYGIPWRGDFDPTQKTLNKSERRLNALIAPVEAHVDLLSYTKSDIGAWIDAGYDAALRQFTACGGQVAARAGAVNPAGYRVEIEPTIWQTSVSNTGWAAGETIEDQQLIKVVSWYFSEGMHLEQSLKDIIVWEQGNHIAYELGIQPEPRSAGWPCK